MKHLTKTRFPEKGIPMISAGKACPQCRAENGLGTRELDASPQDCISQLSQQFLRVSFLPQIFKK